MNAGSFEDFVHATGARLTRTAVLLCGDRDQAEDLVQSAYATVFAKWRLVSRADSPLAYARTILTRIYLAERRRKRISEVPLTKDPAARPHHVDLRVSLMSALNDLGPVDRAVVVLRYWEDLSVAETAELLHLSDSACRTRSSRALARLRTLHPSLADPQEQ